MGETRDYVALDWVSGEIAETLSQARIALESFVENPEDTTKLRFCLSYIHQVAGTLRMLEFHGAGMLAEEMERMAAALVSGKLQANEETLEALMAAILQLPSYIDHIKQTQRDVPTSVVPVMNNLRAARGGALVSSTNLFTPSIPAEQAVDESAKPKPVEASQFAQFVQKLHKMFQISLLGIVRNQELKKNVDYLLKVIEKLIKLGRGSRLQPLWHISYGFLQVLQHDQTEINTATKTLLKHINVQLKSLVENGQSGLDREAPAELFKNLLYYIAKSDVDTAAIRQIRKDYKLDEALPDKATDSGAAFGGADATAVRSVVDGLMEELIGIKDSLEIYVSTGSGVDALKEVEPHLKRVVDTMSVLGLMQPLRSIREQHQRLQEIILGGSKPADEVMLEMAGSIIAVEAALQKGAETGEDADAVKDAEQQLSSAHKTVIREARNGLELAKESIIEFVATQWDRDRLKSFTEIIHEIHGGLAIIPLRRAANILHACSRFVSQKLMSGSEAPEWSQLDTLADAIASVDYYLERMLEDANTSMEVLNIAIESVDKLGYPVGKIVDNVVEDYHPEAEDDVPAVMAVEHVVAAPVPEEDSGSEEPAADTADPEADDAPESVDAADAEPAAAVAEAEPPAEEVSAPEDVSDELIDDEIVEIFIEEAREVLDTIDEFLPQWLQDWNNIDARTEVRRAFHTLKGSGRMVNANEIGELAWSIENMLNRVIDHTVPLTVERLDLIQTALVHIPEMVAAFEARRAYIDPEMVEQIQEQAFAFAERDTVTDAADETVAEAVAETPAIEVATDKPEAEPESEATATEVESGDEDDEDRLALIEIFAGEAEVHLQTMKEFLDYADAINGPVELADNIQRALHTLKGSAHMAEIEPIARIVTPVEKLVKEMRASQIKAQADVVGILHQLDDMLQSGISQLATEPQQELAGTEELLQAVAAADQQWLGSSETIEAHDGVNPEHAANFLGEAMDLLDVLEPLLTDWGEHNIAPERSMGILSRMQEVAVEASELDIDAFSNLSMALFEFLSNNGEQMLNEQATELTGQTFETLLNMLDRVAAGQTVVEEEGLIERLEALERGEWIPADAQIQAETDDAETDETEGESESEQQESVDGLEENDELDAGADVEETLDVEAETEAEAEGQLAGDYDTVELEDSDTEESGLGTLVATGAALAGAAAAGAAAAEVSGAVDGEANADSEIPGDVDQYSEDELQGVESAASSLEHDIPEDSDEALVDLSELTDELGADASDGDDAVPETVELGADDAEPRESEFAADEQEIAEDVEVDSTEGLDGVEVAEFETLEAEDTAVEATDYDTVEMEADADAVADEPDSEVAEPDSEAMDEEDLAAEATGESDTTAESSAVDDHVGEEMTDDDGFEADTDLVNFEAVEDTQQDEAEAPLAVEIDEEILEIFLEESDDLIEGIEESVHQWQNNHDDTAQMAELQRLLHTLKGGARLAGMAQVGDYSHDFESYLIQADNQHHGGAFPDEFFARMQFYTDQLIAMVNAVSAGNYQFPVQEFDAAESGAEAPEAVAQQEEEPLSSGVEASGEDQAAAVVEPVVEPEPEVETAEEIDEEILEIFQEEASDLIEAIEESVNRWIDDNSDYSQMAEMQRLLHTIKGGARLAGLRHIGDLSHDFETFLIQSDNQHHGGAFPQEFFAEVQNNCDRLMAMVQAVLAGNLSFDAIPAPQTETGEAAAPAPDAQVLEEELSLDDVDSALTEATAVEDQADTAIAQGDDDVEDGDFDEEIVEIFVDEATDLAEAIDECVHRWVADHSETAQMAELQRLLHTLKGGARLSGLSGMGDLSHDFETFLIQADNQYHNSSYPDEFFSEMQAYQDRVLAMVSAVAEGNYRAALAGAADSNDEEGVEASEVPEFVVEEADSETGDEQDDSPVGDLHERSREVLEEGKRALAEIDNVVPFAIPEKKQKPTFSPPVAGVQQGNLAADTDTQPAKRGQQEQVKVSANLLEDLVNLAGETSISRARAEEQVSEIGFALDDMDGTIARLQEQLRRLDIETEAQILFRQEQVESEGIESFDPLEMDRYSQLQQLARSLVESASDILDIKSSLVDKARDMETLLLQQSRINTELQEGLMRSRMVPISRLIPRLRRIVRQVSGELGKQVDFQVGNIEGELDRTVLERMVAPLEHMLRNAVDHGIEDREQREQRGKSAVGIVELGVEREGGEVVMVLKDDGGGIDLTAVRAKAIERDLMDDDAELSDHEILQFILHSGFSTAKQVTQISGRGVGMDVVHSEIKQLGGSVDIDSAFGAGTQFSVRLPFTVSVNRALMVGIGKDTYALPLNSIEGIVRVSPYELEAYYQPDAPSFEYAGQNYSMRYMGSLLHVNERPKLDGHSMPLPVVLVRSSEHAVAIQVDRLMGSREIVVKALGPQFSAVQGLSGATVLGDGSVVVILDLLALVRQDASHAHAVVDLLNAESGDVRQVEKATKTVMVVDDSVTVRKVTSRFLEREGYEVVVAKDGVDAVTQLQDFVPDLMLLDIEMPRMDGFEVASRVRRSPRLQNIPIIMITSRTGDKHRDRAMSLGVNQYMGKPYQELQLLGEIEQLLNPAPSQ